jgi:hypothetical protein
VTKESRYNLIFLGVLLAVMVPGAVVVFRKKMEPVSRPMFEPDPVVRGIAYMSRLPVPPGKHLMEPTHTSAWVEQVARQHAGESGDSVLVVPHDVNGLPLMSHDKSFQVLAVRRDAAKVTVWVLFWHDEPAGGAGAWRAEPGGISGTVAASGTLAIPGLVRDELGEHEIFRPPKTALLQEIAVPETGRPAAQLQVVLKSGGGDSARIPQIAATGPSAGG